jgi:hypothetical protein
MDDLQEILMIYSVDIHDEMIINLSQYLKNKLKQ